MRRTNLDRGLQELNSQVIHLSSLIEQAHIKTLKSLEMGDLTSLTGVIEADSSIKIYCAEIERNALRILLLQQPLAGQDMRFLTAILHISSDLSRINDTVIEVAETILKIALASTESASGNLIDLSQYNIPVNAVDRYGNMTDAFIIRGLLDLGKEIMYLFQQMIESFNALDFAIAKNIELDRDSVQSRYMTLCNDILNMQAQKSALLTLQYDASIIQRATHFLWIAHKLEQIANHLSSICKRIIFIVEG